MNNKKKIILSILVVLLLLAIGVTYAFFTYESGTKSDIVTGQIYMNYEETSTISLTGVFPETKAQALERQDENGVFEFTITGRNTSNQPVYYEIDLLEGGLITGTTESSTKILPEHVMIYLEKDGVPVIDGETYTDFNNRRIYTDTIPANQTSNIEHKYTLRMWIDENVTISDTNPDADYTTSEWNDAYTSLKVRVVGDFEYKEIATDASCFTYNVDSNGIIYDYPIITLDTSEEKVNACKTATLNNFDGEDLSTAQDGYQSYCEGTGTITNFGFSWNLIDDIAELVFWGVTTDEIKSQFPVVSNVATETRYYELNNNVESVNSCKEYMLRYDGGDWSDAQDGYQSFCEGTGTWFNNYSIYDVFDIDYANDGYGMLSYNLIERNVFNQVESLQGEIEITDYDYETCGTDVIIPSIIKGLPVTRIVNPLGDNAFMYPAKNISSVKLPETLQHIGEYAFYQCNLSSLIIPDSVISIGTHAFAVNPLTTVIIGKNVHTIENYAFANEGAANYSTLRTNYLNSVTIKGKTSLDDFSSLGGFAFGWADGYSNDDIVFVNE